MSVDDLIAKAASQGASGDYSNLGSIMKNAQAYQAFKDARLNRVKAERIAKKPLITQQAPPPKVANIVPAPIQNSGAFLDANPGSRSLRVSPTPETPSPSPTSASAVNPPPPPVKTATLDIILFDEEATTVDTMADLIFENIGGQELINITRSDIVNGQKISYQPIKNLSSIQQRYNPNNILSLQQTSDKYFSGFPIKLEEKIPIQGGGQNGTNVYMDSLGNLIIEFVNIGNDEQIEAQITVGGTIYEIDLGEES
jgi:hypothetical protein